MQSDLKETMPLFSPVYNPEYLQNEQALLYAIKNNNFTADTNDLAEEILYDDPGNYNAWYLKKKYILSYQLAGTLTQEVLTAQNQFVNISLSTKVKGFQVWEHKRLLTQLGSDYKQELKLIENVLLEKDQKNYHAWSFRVWLTQYAKIHQEELLFAEKMIQKDPYNNSAWNHLYFTLQGRLKQLQNEQEKKTILNKYISYVLESLKNHSYNRAAWNFLRGLFPSIKLKKVSCRNVLNKTLIASYDEYPDITKYCQEEWKRYSQTDKKDEGIENILRQILSTLIHIYSQKEDTIQYAKNICEELKGKELQRVHYWTWIQSNL